MIIIKYLIKEVLKNQLNILFILTTILLCQKLIQTLHVMLNNNISINLFFELLGLGLSEMFQLILPFSLFLSLIFTFSYLYSKNEIIVMYACGLSKNMLIKVSLIISVITVLFTIINIVWINPWSLKCQKKILLDMKINPNISTLMAKNFKLLENGQLIIFINNINDNELKNIFVAKSNLKNHSYLSVIIANQGHIDRQLNGSQLITLRNGTLYESNFKLKCFRVTNFAQYSTLIKHYITKLNYEAEYMTMKELWLSKKFKARVEFHWRITLILSSIIMAIMAVPLSLTNLYRTNNMLNILISVILYLLFFLIQISLHSNGIKGKINPIFFMWFVNLFYLSIAIIFNFINKVFSRN